MKKYIALAPNNAATHLRIDLDYSLGGYNVFTGKSESRGYYLSVMPVTRERVAGATLESFTAFSGIKQCIKPVSRKSEKAARDAENVAASFENDLIQFVLKTNNLQLSEGEN